MNKIEWDNKRSLKTRNILSILFFSALLFLLFSTIFSETIMAFDFSTITVTDAGISVGGSATASTDYTAVTNEIKGILQWVTGLLALVMFFFLILQFMKLGASGDNEQARKKAIQGILTSGIALSLFGGSSFIIGFFWNAFSTPSTGATTVPD